MSAKSRLKQLLRPAAALCLDAVARRVAARSGAIGGDDPRAAASVRFDLDLLAAARSLAASGDHRRLPPTFAAPAAKRPEEVRIGYFGNLANNAYIYVKCLRRLGYDAELVIENGSCDLYLMNRPFWEDVEVEADSLDEALAYEAEWAQPHFVRTVAFDHALQARYAGRYSAVPEVQAVYAEKFGRELPADRALLLAQNMGHWPFLLAMKRFDVVQLSGAAIALGPFAPCATVIYPTGSDLFLVPFEDSVFGLLVRAGYAGAAHIIYAGSNYPEYLDRLGVSTPRSYGPAMMDTHIYAPGDGGGVRQRWIAQSRGRRFLLSVCRQNWQWKGNDTLLRGFRRFLDECGDNDWRLVMQTWGPDVERSKALAAELGLIDRIIWEKLCSRPALRKRQQAADLVVDQFAMEGYGTSVLETLCAARPVMMRFDPADVDGLLGEPPPLLAASDEREIAATLADPSRIGRHGPLSRDWILRTHGYEGNAPRNYLPYLIGAALGRPPAPTSVASLGPRRAVFVGGTPLGRAATAREVAA